MPWTKLNSLTHGECGSNCRSIIAEDTARNASMILLVKMFWCEWYRTSLMISQQCCRQGLAWNLQATIHWSSKHRSRFLPPYGVTRPQWFAFGYIFINKTHLLLFITNWWYNFCSFNILLYHDINDYCNIISIYFMHRYQVRSYKMYKHNFRKPRIS